MSPGYDRPLYILAFDHRTSLQTKLFGISGTPSPEERERMAEAKRIIARGSPRRRRDRGARRGRRVTDEEHGPEAARLAKAHGLPMAVAAEESSQPEFDFEYGDRYRRAHRGARPRAREGPCSVQPRGRRRHEPTAGRAAGRAVGLARSAGHQVPLRADRPAGARARPATALRPSCAPASSPPRSASSRPPGSSPMSGRSKA